MKGLGFATNRKILKDTYRKKKRSHNINETVLKIRSALENFPSYKTHRTLERNLIC